MKKRKKHTQCEWYCLPYDTNYIYKLIYVMVLLIQTDKMVNAFTGNEKWNKAEKETKNKKKHTHNSISHRNKRVETRAREKERENVEERENLWYTNNKHNRSMKLKGRTIDKYSLKVRLWPRWWKRKFRKR